jgi:aspartyl-tRNA(Asn)/glutamyl-tRNA(Gln) amidotransferase subunit B
MEKGQMRCDVNISLRPVGQKEFGVKVEIKNLNSFRAAHRAIAYEIGRQTLELNRGGRIDQETRGWNDDSGETYLMRGKESAHDYRYFPEPDLMPVSFSEEEIEAIAKAAPELPEARRERFVSEFGLTPYDAHVLTLEKDIADYFEIAVKGVKTAKTVANWITSELLRELADAKLEIPSCKIKADDLGRLVSLIENGTINGKIAKDVFAKMFATGKSPDAIVKEDGLVQVADSGAIAAFVDQVIAANPAQVQQFKEGKTTVLQYLVGQVMKASKGKANPQMVNKLLAEKLG